jgi:DNA-binding response OmpR family regulator
MMEYFTHRGFAVDCARSVRQAELLLAANCYAAMITDLQLTTGNARQGFELITYVRQHWPSVYVILLTADDSLEVEVEAHRRGVAAFLHKPVPLSNVERTLHGLLASRHDSRQR